MSYSLKISDRFPDPETFLIRKLFTSGQALYKGNGNKRDYAYTVALLIKEYMNAVSFSRKFMTFKNISKFKGNVIQLPKIDHYRAMRGDPPLTVPYTVKEVSQNLFFDGDDLRTEEIFRDTLLPKLRQLVINENKPWVDLLQQKGITRLNDTNATEFSDIDNAVLGSKAMEELKKSDGDELSLKGKIPNLTGHVSQSSDGSNIWIESANKDFQVMPSSQVMMIGPKQSTGFFTSRCGTFDYHWFDGPYSTRFVISDKISVNFSDTAKVLFVDYS